jgi:hypothetical protein
VRSRSFLHHRVGASGTLPKEIVVRPRAENAFDLLVNGHVVLWNYVLVPGEEAVITLKEDE